MSSQIVNIPRTSDRAVHAVFRELGERFGVPKAYVSALAFAQIGEIALIEEPGAELSAVLKHDAYLLDRFQVQVAGMTVMYMRGGHADRDKQSAIYDAIELRENNIAQAPSEQRIEVVAFLSEKFGAFESQRIIAGSLTDEQAQLLAIHHSTLERLERLNEELVRGSDQFRRKLEEQFVARRDEVEKAYLKKEEELAEGIRARANELQAERLALEERLRLIDDRDNTHARREIRDRMLEDVKQRVSQFGVSPTTEKKRRPVLIGIAGLLFLLLALIVWTVQEIGLLDQQYRSGLGLVAAMRSPDTVKPPSAIKPEEEALAQSKGSDASLAEWAGNYRSHLYWLWLRFAMLTLGLVGTCVYYIRWQAAWADNHAATEFQLRQFQIDISRANWVVESCLEWRKDTEKPIPDALLDSITRNLFSSPNQPEQVLHPADELASALLGSASKLKLKSGDNELEFNKPGKIPEKL